MQDIRWSALWVIAGLILASLMTWAVFNKTVALLFFIVGLQIYLFTHIFWIHKLHTWIQHPNLSSIPEGQGIWEDIFAAIYHQQRRHSRSQAQIVSVLDRFRHAASALPDGVVLLNSEDKIEWCNPPAERLLGLSLDQDTNQPINYLLRHTDFIDYLQSHDYELSIKLRSWLNAELTLEIQLVEFGDKRKLLIVRDISQSEKLDAMRKDFIANVSHELRTPLTVVGGFIETLMDMEGAVPKETRAYFEMMAEQTARMRRLIEELLVLSQLESNASQPIDSKIDMNNMLKTVLNEAEGLSLGKHTISTDIQTNLSLIGSNEELHSVFSNLVSNAIRYTPEGGHIFVRWHAEDDHAVYSVTDNGIGIEQKHIDRLTERFYRVDRSRSRATGGTGLGLSIVKHILTRHQAYLSIESEFGKGSTFKAIFPTMRTKDN